MRIDTLSTFPDMFSSVMGSSMMKRAQEKGILDFNAHDLRQWTYDRHRTTDDYPYGGGIGLVMKCEPVFEAVDALLGRPHPAGAEGAPYCAEDEGRSIIIPAPHGMPLTDEMAADLSTKEHLVFICGHYEGMDERIYRLADAVISIGDYVLTSGELASMVIIDAVVRKIPGVLGAAEGAQEESFVDGLLEHPQYTRPATYRGMAVPDVLLSGHHAQIERWRREQSLRRTAQLRPDLIASCRARGALDGSDLEFLESLEYRPRRDG